MAISTNGLQLARIAGAVFNQQLSASDYSEILTANKTAAELDAWANAAVAAEFKGKTTTDIAKAVLANVGLTTVSGLEAWVAGQLTAGGGVAKAGATLLSMLNDYSNMSTTEAIYGASVVTFNQKTANSQALSQTAGTAGGTYAAVSAATPSAAFTLTTGVDLRTTGSGADTFTSVNPALATATMTAGDNIDGGAGSDTLSITTAAEMTLGTGVIMNNVENVTVSASGGALTLDTAQMTGITAVTNSGSTQNVSITGLKALVPVSVTATSANTSVAFATAVTSGSSDAITVNLNGVGTSVITANGFETINVASSGSASGGSSSIVNGTTVASTTLSTLNVTGTAAAKLVANLAGASAAVTGTVTSDDSGHDVDITGRALTDKLSVSMGGGNDTLRVNTVSATHTIAGGEGTDTLRYSGDTAVLLAATANVTGIETVTLSATTPTSFAMTGAGVTTVNYTTAAAGTFGGLSTGGTINLNAGGSMTAAAAGAAATATAAATLTAATYSGTADSLTVNVGTSLTTSGATSSTVSAVGVESVTFNSLAATGSTEARSVTFSDTTATTAALKTITVTGSIPALTTVAVTNAGTNALTTVNLSGVTGGASFTGGATAGTSITGGVGNDSLTGGAGPDNIIGGEGNDTIGGAAGADSIDAGNGTNSITGGAGADTMTGGTGVDTYVFVSNDTLNTTPVVTSTTSAPDTITNFTSGVDKISITGTNAPVLWLNNYTNIQAALSAQSATGAIANSAAFVTGENTLYVFKNTTGLLNVDDIAIKLPGVTSMAAGDLFLGSVAGGSAITSSSSSTTVLNVTLTNTPVGESNTTLLNTTDLNDTVGANTVNIVAATLTGGLGSDAITIANASTSTTASHYDVSPGALVTGFESVVLPNAVSATGSRFILDSASVAANSTFSIDASAFQGADVNGALVATGLTITAQAALTNAKVSITGGQGHDSITGGAGNDTLLGGVGDDTLIGAAGTNSISGGAGNDSVTSGSLTDLIDGGSGNDTITLPSGTFTGTLAGGTNIDTLNLPTTAVNIATATLSGFETLALASGVVATMTLAQLAGFTTNITGAGTTSSADQIALTGAGGTVTLPETQTVEIYNLAALTSTPTISATSLALLRIDGSTVTGVTNSISVTGNIAADVSITGGGSNDTFNLTNGTTATFTSADTIIGGAGTDTLNIIGNATVSTGGLVAANFSGIEVLTFANTTTGVTVALTAATLPSSTALTVTTSQTTGVLSWDGSANATTATMNITGGNADDSIQGGLGADTLTGGTGSDILYGGGGIDQLFGGTGNNTLSGGLGADTITLGVGSDTIVIDAGQQIAFSATSGDTVIGFTTGALASGGDKISLSIGDLSTGTNAVTLSNTAGDINGAAAAVFQLAAPGAATAFTTAGANVIWISGTTGTTLATALNGGSITGVSSALEYAVVYYDADLNGGSMVVSAVGATSTGTTLAAGAVTETILVTGAMTPTEFGALVIANFTFVA